MQLYSTRELPLRSTPSLIVSEPMRILSGLAGSLKAFVILPLRDSVVAEFIMPITSSGI